MHELIRDLVEDFDAMCALVELVDFVAFYDGYVSYEAWKLARADDEDTVLLLAS